MEELTSCEGRDYSLQPSSLQGILLSAQIYGAMLSKVGHKSEREAELVFYCQWHL